MFKEGDTVELQRAKKDIKLEILKAKRDYKYKLENKMATNNLGSAWDSMKTIAGLQNLKSSSPVTLNGFSSDTELANALSQFHNRFDIFDFRNEIDTLSNQLVDVQHFNITQTEVQKAFCCHVSIDVG